MKPLAHAQAVYDALLRKLNCSDVAGLMDHRRATTDQITAIADQTQGYLPYSDTWMSSQWAPVIDGVEILEDPVQLLAKGEIASCVPVIIGSNRDDGTEYERALIA